jgi:hypothetical protein
VPPSCSTEILTQRPGIDLQTTLAQPIREVSQALPLQASHHDLVVESLDCLLLAEPTLRRVEVRLGGELCLELLDFSNGVSVGCHVVPYLVDLVVVRVAGATRWPTTIQAAPIQAVVMLVSWRPDVVPSGPALAGWATAIKRAAVSRGEVAGFRQTSSVSRLSVIVMARSGHAVVWRAAVVLMPCHRHRHVFAAVVRSIRVRKKRKIKNERSRPRRWPRSLEKM